MDLTDRLDRSIGPAPATDDRLDALLADGRRVVRRRRLALAATGVAVVLVAGGTAAAVATRPAPDRPDERAPVATDTDGDRTLSRGEMRGAAHLVSWHDGTWTLDPDAQALRRVDDPYGLASTGGGSVGLEVRWHGAVVWVVSWVDGRDGSGGMTASTPGLEDTDFTGFVVRQHGTVPPQSWPPTITATPVGEPR
jgi:hypothetical protein